MKHLLWLVGMLTVACWLAWRALVLAMQPPTTFVPAEGLPEAAPALQARLQAQPTDARALVRWALLSGQPADRLRRLELAAGLAPAQPQVQQALAEAWLAQDRLDLALQAWLRLLQGRPQVEALLFPRLLQVLETPVQRAVFWAQLPQSLPDWWPRFASYVARQTQSLEALGALVQFYRLRAPPPPAVQQAVLARLEQDAPYPYYYATWLELLSETERRQVRYLYDGHFTQPLTGVGFSWRPAVRAGVTVERFAAPAPVQGQAVRVQLTAAAQPGALLSQPLMLRPGRYRLEGQVRLRELYGQGGVEWRLICAQPPGRAPLATGPIWFGEWPAWQNFALDFKVGVECQRPLLQLALRAAGQTTVSPRGELWLHRLNLQRVGG